MLMYHNRLDTQRKAREADPDRRLDVTLPVAYIVNGKVYFFDYIVDSIRRPNNELIEKISIEEAVQVYNENPEKWDSQMRRLC